MSNAGLVDAKSDHAPLPFWDEKPLLQKIVSMTPNVLYVYNAQTGTNEFLNSSLGASMGYSVGEVAAMGADFMPMICHSDDLPRVFGHMQGLSSLGAGDIAQIEYRMKAKSGEWRWMLSHDAVFDLDAKGDVLRLIGVATDITDRKHAEENARAEKRAADSANEELRTFAYALSHDLKSPTNTLQLLLSELLDEHSDQLDRDARSLVDMSVDMVQKMQKLVEDILSYTRVIGSDVAFEVVRPASMLATVQQNLGGDIRTTKAQIIIGDLPKVNASPIQLQVYLQNVIGNAIKYNSPDRSPVIHVEGWRRDSDGRVFISVRDNGLGISEENQQRIFGMFKRLHLEAEIEGTGLGLALCQRIAVNHGGKVAVTSTLGEGATFTIDFPGP